MELYDSVVIPALGLVEQDRHQGVLRRCLLQLLLSLYRRASRGTHRLSAERRVRWFPPLFSVQEDFAVVCISGTDQADELTTHMLVQLMERASNQTLYLPASVSDEILDSLAANPTPLFLFQRCLPLRFLKLGRSASVSGHTFRKIALLSGFGIAAKIPTEPRTLASSGSGAADHSRGQYAGAGLGQVGQWHLEARLLRFPGCCRAQLKSWCLMREHSTGQITWPHLE